MIKYVKIPFSFNAQQMQQEVAHLHEEWWKLHYQKLHYEGEWKGIPLRSLEGKTDTILVSPHSNATYRDTALLEHCTYFKQILSRFACPLKAVRLLKLNAGAVIKEHRDIDLCFEKGEIRIHIPVITSDAVEFYLDSERIHLREGECWYMNFNLPHYINNKSGIDRIHLVIDAEVNDWVRELFSRKGLVRKEAANDPYDEKMKKEMISRFREMKTPTANRLADELESSLVRATVPPML